MFRILFVAQALLLAVNLKLLLHLHGNFGNVIQKALIILTGVVFMATRPVHRGVVAILCVMVVVSLFCGLESEFRGFQWRLYFGGLVSIVAPFILLAAEPDVKDRILCLRTFALLPLIMVAIGGVYMLCGISPLFGEDSLGAVRLSASQGAAWLAGACFTGAFAALELADRRHIRYATLVLINIVILILTGGRMALALTLVVCGLGFLSGFRRFPLMKVFTPIYLALCAGVFLVFFGGNLLRRFQSHSLQGRDLLWRTLSRQLHSHPWFGVGLGNQQLLIPESLTEKTSTIAAHDEYLRIAVELGYPGAAVFFALSLGILYVVWNAPWVRRDRMFVVCAAAFYVYCLTDNPLSAPQMFFILVAASFAGKGRGGVDPMATRIVFPTQDAPVVLTGPS